MQFKSFSHIPTKFSIICYLNRTYSAHVTRKTRWGSMDGERERKYRKMSPIETSVNEISNKNIVDENMYYQYYHKPVYIYIYICIPFIPSYIPVQAIIYMYLNIHISSAKNERDRSIYLGNIFVYTYLPVTYQCRNARS